MPIRYINNTQIVKEIKKLMLDSDISQRCIAEKLNITPQGLTKLLNKKNFGFEDAKKILNVMGYALIIEFEKSEEIKEEIEMIDISDLRTHYEQGRVVITIHAQERLRQRKIKTKDVKSCIMTGEIIEQYPDDFPFPSCLILGNSVEGKPLHVVMSDNGTESRIITAYFPDHSKFESDYRHRKE